MIFLLADNVESKRAILISAMISFNRATQRQFAVQQLVLVRPQQMIAANPQDTQRSGCRTTRINNAVLALVVKTLVVPVRAPLPQIAKHVKETKRIRQFFTARVGSMSTIILVPRDPIYVAVPRVSTITTTCAFPLRFRWQPKNSGLKKWVQFLKRHRIKRQ